MTEEKAKEYILETICRNCSLCKKCEEIGHTGCDTYRHSLKTYKEAYEQGYEDCRNYAHDYYKPKWHDLQENPNDLPEKRGEYWTKYDNASEERGYFYDVHYFEPDKPFYKKYWSEIGVKAWHELPKFEEEE